MPGKKKIRATLFDAVLGKTDKRTASGRKPPKKQKSMREKLKPRVSVKAGSDSIMFQFKKKLR